GLDGSQEEAARSLGLSPWQAFRRVTLPQLRPAMAAGALLSALYTLGDFGVVSLLRYDSFTRAIYTSYRSSFDRTAAAGLSLVLVLLAAIVLVVDARVRGQATLYRVSTGARRPAPTVKLGRWRGPSLVLSVLVAGASLGLPLAVLVFWGIRTVRAGGASPHLLQATQTSLLLGVGAALVAGVAALPIGVLSVRYSSPQTRFMERATYLTYAMPGIVIAIAFVAITVRTPWYQTLGVLVLACACRYLAQAVGATRLSLLQISPRLEEAARGLGCSLPRVLWRVTMPLARPGLLAGVLLVFLTTIKELPITLLLIPAGDRSLPTLIWTAASDARYGEAAIPALLLLAITAVPTYVLAQRQSALLG
ncbi:MAG: iron ABC transporter permease, partial [Thermomicrobiales bacterium]|nr:iron ABC transporter permease [Thermomicrobiales bacterium]